MNKPNNHKDNSLFFDDIYRCHYRVVYAYLLSRVKKVDVTIDLLQDTFIRVWNHIDDLREIPSHRRICWIINIARNCSIDYYRKLSSRIQTEPIINDMTTASINDDPYHCLQSKETMSLLDISIHSLPDELRISFILSVIGELSSNDIAKILECPAGTVRYRISEARKRIAQSIELHMSGK